MENEQVTLLACTATVGLGHGKVSESDLARLDATLVTLKNLNSLLLRAGDLSLAPAAGSSAVAVLNEQVAAADLALALSGDLGASSRGVMLSHVKRQFFGISLGRRLPARLFCGRVEVVGEVLRVRMADFPARW